MLQLCLRLLRSAAKALARVQQPKLHLEQLLEQENLGFGAGKSKFVAGYDKNVPSFWSTKSQISSSVIQKMCKQSEVG